jgi:hypothetical protein
LKALHPVVLWLQMLLLVSCLLLLSA